MATHSYSEVSPIDAINQLWATLAEVYPEEVISEIRVRRTSRVGDGFNVSLARNKRNSFCC